MIIFLRILLKQFYKKALIMTHVASTITLCVDLPCADKAQYIYWTITAFSPVGEHENGFITHEQNVRSENKVDNCG